MKPSSNHTIPEIDLISGCKEGDRRMQEELYRRFSPRMYAVCLRYAGNAEEAEDILQEGFIKVLKNWTATAAMDHLKDGFEGSL
ncbi:MAG: hypothetical protein NVV59_14570 [Chitinophagaceae bacterium]|nr:hypothetical protein [Chitinophagaceae bacterium]